MEQNILSTAEPKLEDILFLQFIVSLWLNSLVVQECPVARAKVNDVGLHPPANCPVGAGILHKPGGGKVEKSVREGQPQIPQLFANSLDNVNTWLRLSSSSNCRSQWEGTVTDFEIGSKLNR